VVGCTTETNDSFKLKIHLIEKIANFILSDDLKNSMQVLLQENKKTLVALTIVHLF
jgi:hypothetical protein